MSDTLKQRGTLIGCLMLLVFLLRSSVGNIGQILRGEVRFSRLLNSEWITIGDLHFQDSSPLGYVATQWGFLIIVLLFTVWLLFEIRKREGLKYGIVALTILAAAGFSSLVLA